MSTTTQNLAHAGDGDDMHALKWLHKMALFCLDLQHLLKTVPADAQLQDFSVSHARVDGQQYPHLAAACDASKTEYMQVH